MRTTEQYVDMLRHYKEANAGKHGIARIGIFGSVARHAQTKDSDVDVCVHLVQPDIFALVHIKEELEEMFQRQVDVVRVHPRMNRLLFNCIQREGIYAD